MKKKENLYTWDNLIKGVNDNNQNTQYTWDNLKNGVKIQEPNNTISKKSNVKKTIVPKKNVSKVLPLTNNQNTFQNISSSKDINVNTDMFRTKLNKELNNPVKNYNEQKSNELQQKNNRIKQLEEQIPILENKLNTSVYSAGKKKEWQTEYNKLQTEYNNLTKDNSTDLGKTLINAPIIAGEKIIKGTENLLVDPFLQLGSSKYNPGMWIASGQTPWSKNQNKLNQLQNIGNDLVKEDAPSIIMDKLGYNKEYKDGLSMRDYLEKNSGIKRDNFAGKLIGTMAQQIPNYMVGGIFGPKASLGSIGVSSYGSGTEEAYQNGSTREQANKYGLMNAGIEIGTEKMFPSINGLYGKSGLRNAIKEINEEGLEEVTSDLLNPLAKKLSYENNKDLKELYKDTNLKSLGESYLLGGASAGLMKGTEYITNKSSNIETNIINKPETQTVENTKKPETKETKLPKINKNYNTLEEDNIQINKKPTDIQELPTKPTNNTNLQESIQNEVQNKQIAPVRTDIKQENNNKIENTVENTTEINNNNKNIVENLKKIRENTTNKAEQIKLDNHIQQIENDIKGLSNDNKSFAQDNKTVSNNISIDESAKRYEDLTKTNKIEYFTKDNGDVRVNLLDSNSNLVNQLDLYNKRSAISELGETLGNKIFETSSVDNQTINLGNDINNMGTETDYFMSHRPTESGITADNMLNQNVETPLPKDILEHPEYYFDMNQKYSQESVKALKEIQNNPDADITIYRATTGDKFNPGDWVTLSKAYAEQHNQSQFNGEGNVIEMKVKPTDIQYAGDDINEWGYFPQNKNVANNKKINYNTNEGDINVRRRSNSNNSKYEHNESSGERKLQGNEKVQNGSTNDNKRNSRGSKETIQTSKERRNYFEQVKNNKPKILTKEQIDLQKEAKKIGIKLEYYIGNENAELLGTTDKGKIYLDINSKNLINESSNLKQRFYHELFHNIARNKALNFSEDIKELKQQVSKDNINEFLKNRGYDSSLFSDDVKLDLAEEVLADYSAKYLAGYDINYNLSPEIEYRLNQILDDTITTMKLNNKKLAPVKEKKDNIPMIKSNDNVKQVKYSKADYEKIADSINNKSNTNTRSWLETSLDSKTLEEYRPELIRGLKDENLTYEVQSNKSTLEKANSKLASMSYEKAVSYIEGKIYDEKNPSLTDIALTERLIQEASKKGDYQTASDLIQDLAIIGTDMGQKIQALSMIKRLTPEGQLSMYQKIVNRAKARGEYAFNDVEITPEMVKTILDAYDKNGNYDQADLNERVEKFKQQVAEQLKSTAGDKLNSWRYLSMLGNPKTHIRNIVSNVAMKGTLKTKNMMARTLETILPVKQENRTKTWKMATNEVKKFAKQTAIDMKDTITGEDKYNEKTQLEQSKKIFKNKALEGISKFNGNALEFEDWLFSKSAFQSAFQEYLTAQGIRTEQDIKDNPKIIEKGKQYAVEQAEIATFRQYSKLASKIAEIERHNKGAKFVIEALVPFKKTPINVAKAGVNYSPLGLTKSVFYDSIQLKKGNINGSQFIDNLSQGMTGTSLALLGYMLAKSGILSGSGDDDKEGKYNNQLGNQNYALNLGGNSYSISWLSPVAMPLLVGANSYEKLEKQEGWDANIVMDSLASTLDPLSSMSFVSGLTDTLNSYSKGSSDMIKDIGLNTAESYILQYVPTLSSQFASVTDDKKRSTKASNNSKFKWGEEVGRQIMYKIPGLRQQLEVSTDIWGNEKEQSNNIVERAFETFISPYSKTKDITTNLDKELKKVYNETGEIGVIPGVPYGYIKNGDETYRMSAKEYTNYKKTYGQTANKTLNEVISSKSYKNADYDDKVKMIENVYKYSRESAKKEYFDDNDIDYESKLLNKLDTLKKNYNVSPSKYFENKKEYDYAYRYPDNYNFIRQITTYDNYNEYTDKIKNIKESYNTTNKRLNAVANYVNTLDLSVPQKAMLIKQNYKSFKKYDSQIIKYVNSQNLTVQEKTSILEKIGFKVKNGRVY